MTEKPELTHPIGPESVQFSLTLAPSFAAAVESALKQIANSGESLIEIPDGGGMVIVKAGTPEATMREGGGYIVCPLHAGGVKFWLCQA